MAEAEKHQKKQPEKESPLVIVEFPNGVNEKGEVIYREQEVSREIANAQLALPESADKIREGEPVKLRNAAYRGARLKK